MRSFTQRLLILMMAALPVSIAFAQDTATPSATVPPVVTDNPTATATTTLAPTPTQAAIVTYVVRPGDNLFRIARRFGTTVSALAAENGITNPTLIFTGQVLRIPGVTPTATPVPTGTPSPTPTLDPNSITEYVVVRGDTLFRIAARFGTTVAAILRINNLSNPNLIYSGQRLIIPLPATAAPATPAAASSTPTSTDQTTETTVPSPTPTLPPTATPTSIPAVATEEIAANAEAIAGFSASLGVEAYFVGQDAEEIAAQIRELGATWAKVNVDWRDLELTQGVINFATLDTIVAALEGADLDILFTVSTTPTWARSTVDENGPPDDFANFAAFVGALATHYQGQVAAYEIWNEPNLRREWNNTQHPISAASYLELLRLSYEAVKTADPNTTVISAGLAPTGFNDGINAIDDRVFLSALYQLGLAQYNDGIGAHPAGYANPPDARCCTQPEGVATHYDAPSFFFLNTLEDYNAIMRENADLGTPIIVTRFGWGTSEDTTPPSAINIFYSYTSLEEQATYTPRGLELGEQLGYVGAMVISNLNGCVARPGDTDACYTSLIAPDGSPRPVYEALSSMAAQAES